MAHKKVLSELREECHCEREGYCPLELLLISIGDRVLEQHKMVEFYRWKLGEQGKPDLPWEEVYQKWIGEGYAARFAQIYSEDKTYKQMRGEIFDDFGK